MYGNDISHCVDDGFEIDYDQANERLSSNSVTAGQMAAFLDRAIRP